MTDLAQKARHGRLAALGALRGNGAEVTNIFADGGRFHASNRQNVVMFLSRRASRSSGGMVG
jgi:hypothetical protein